MIFLRIFKNRGDIYIPSSKVKSNLEQKILLVILAFIVAFSAVFLILQGIKYDFSLKNFFAPDNIKIENTPQEENLPKVSGKNNFIFIMSNSDTQEIFSCSIIQVDMDELAYKVCTVDKNTVIEGRTISQIYNESGAGSVLNAVSVLFGTEIDRYIDESINDYKNIFDEFGAINYVVLSDIRYKDTSKYGFNIKLKEGSQTVNGDVASKLIRYYLEIKNYDVANEIILTALSQQINPENYEKRERLFASLIEKSKTNITINDYTKSEDNLKVLSSEATGIKVFSVVPVYENSVIPAESVKEIKNSFAK